MSIRILIASDKYKGSLSAMEVCTTISNAIHKINPKIETIISPMADGGEGTVETLVESQGGEIIEMDVTGPLGEKVPACFGLLKKKIAVIEMASASGLVLVPEEKRNPMNTTTYGTGELIKKAVDIGCREFIIGIGGSATNDGGIGMAQALGIRFLDKKGNPVGYGGKELLMLDRIDMSSIHPAIAASRFYVASDVDNSLTGKEGAAFIYGPQKGADHEMIRILDRGLVNFARVIRKDLGIEIENIKGAGAAGGLGGGLIAFLGAVLRPGTEIMIETTKLETKMRKADLVITGEGAFDQQTFFGKSAYGVAKLAKKYGKPVITINGSVIYERKDISGREEDLLFDGNFSILNKPMELREAIKNARCLLENAAMEITSFYLAAGSKNINV